MIIPMTILFNFYLLYFFIFIGSCKAYDFFYSMQIDVFRTVCEPMAAEMQLSCICRTIPIDILYLSISVICCDLELHMLHHSFQRLQSWVNPAADSVLVDSLPAGGPDFITDRESICKQQKSPLIALTHGMCMLG